MAFPQCARACAFSNWPINETPSHMFHTCVVFHQYECVYASSESSTAWIVSHTTRICEVFLLNAKTYGFYTKPSEKSPYHRSHTWKVSLPCEAARASGGNVRCCTFCHITCTYKVCCCLNAVVSELLMRRQSSRTSHTHRSAERYFYRLDFPSDYE